MAQKEEQIGTASTGQAIYGKVPMRKPVILPEQEPLGALAARLRGGNVLPSRQVGSPMGQLPEGIDAQRRLQMILAALGQGE